MRTEVTQDARTGHRSRTGPTRRQTSQAVPASDSLARISRARPPVDIRFSVLGYFFVFMSGKERRDPARIAAEMDARPLVTWTNLPVLVPIWAALIYSTWALLGVIGGAVYGS